MADIKARVGQENAVRIAAAIAGGADKANRAVNVDGGYADVTSLNVTGITTLKSLLVSETSDFVGFGSFRNSVSIDENLELGGYLKVGGTSEFIGIVTFRGGTINLGDSTSDGINVAGEFISHLVPDANASYNLGTYEKKWNNAWFSGLSSTRLLSVSETSSFSGVATFFDTVVIDSNDYIQIPAGTSAQRGSSPTSGQIRYNSDYNIYEGYISGTENRWASLTELIDQDRNTYISVIDPDNADPQQIIQFYVDNEKVVSISTSLYSFGIAAPFPKQSFYLFNTDLSIDSSSHLTASSASFTGVTTFTNNVYFNKPVDFNDTVRFDYTSSVQIPVGFTSQRNSSGDEYEGQIRFNTETKEYEGYGAGSVWNRLGGVSDIDKDTYISAEDDRANSSDEDILKFYAGGSLSGTISSSSTQINTGTLDLTPSNGTNTAYINGPSQILIDPSPLFGSHTSDEIARGTVRIKGDLYVDGTKFEVESTTVNIADFRVGIGTTAIDDVVLDGAGIGIGSIGYEKTFTWDYANTSLSSSEHINVADGKVYKINGEERLSDSKLTLGDKIEIINSNDDFVIEVDDSENLRLKNGNLGIGTTNPIQRLQIGDADSPNNEIFVVTSVGDVGIGTKTPTTDLDVRGNVNVVGYVTVTDGLYYDSGDFNGPNGISYFNNNGKLIGAASTSSGLATTSYYILTTDNLGVPVWTSTIDGGEY